MATTKSICVDVNSNFTNAWFETEALPEERTQLLEFALSLPRHMEQNGWTSEVEKTVSGAIETSLVKMQKEKLSILEANNESLKLELSNNRIQVAHMQGTTSAKCYEMVGEERKRHEGEVRTLEDRLRHSSEEILRITNEARSLRALVDDLRMPASRGRSGEEDIAETLQQCGFDVIDTSNGAYRDEGHLDLLVSPPFDKDLKIGIECKNVAVVEVKGHLDVFRTKSKEGVKKGLFHTSIFISLRAHTKLDSPHVLETLVDDSGSPISAISFFGPERGCRDTISKDSVESLVLVHSAFAHNFQSGWSRPEPPLNEDSNLQQTCFQNIAERMQEFLVDMTQQSKYISNMQKSIQATRLRTISMLHQMHLVAKQTSLKCTEPQWLSELNCASEHMASGRTDVQVWNNLSQHQKKRINDCLGGKDTFVKSARGNVQSTTSDEGE